MPNSEPKTNIHIAIDLGASSGRVIAGFVQDEKLHLNEIHRFENTAVELPSGLYWNIFGLFQEILTGLKNAIDLHAENIASIAIDTWGCDFGLFDKNGEIIGMPHQYRDPRNEGMAEKMHAILPEKDIYVRTGIKTNFYNSSLHLLSLAENNSPALSAAEDLLFIPDILAYWLTGKKAVERTIASTSQLLDPVTGDWATDVIETLGLPSKIFKKTILPGTILGDLRPELKASLGRCDIPFVAAPSHDTAAAVAGTPLSSAEPLWLSSGTWSIMGVESRDPITCPQALERGFCNELGINGSVRFLQNIAGLWIIQECKRHWDLEGQNHSFAELAEMAEKVEPFFAFIDPDEPSFASPGDMPQKIQTFCKNTNQKVPTTMGEILRVVTDSLALKYRYVYEEIVKFTERTYSRIHIGGGGIQNEALCQATANALNLEVQAGPIEATSCGNIITQMIATGEVADLRSARALIRQSFEFKTYLPSEPQSWDTAYANFLKLLP